MSKVDGKALYEKVKHKSEEYEEARHCPMILDIMGKEDGGCFSEFCVRVGISDRTFFRWVNKHPIFAECYGLGRMFARLNWEREGRLIKDEVHMPGVISNKFEHWKMQGWTRFGIGKINRVRLDLDPKASPDKHYSQLLDQAANGDFTAGEIKQLMESINVGLNTHQVFKMQDEINQLKNDLAVMSENSNGNDSGTNKGITKKD